MLTCPWQEPLSGQARPRPRGGGSAADPCPVAAQGGWGAPLVNPRPWRASVWSLLWISVGAFPCSEMALLLVPCCLQLTPLPPFIFLRRNVSALSPGSAGGGLHGRRPCSASPGSLRPSSEDGTWGFPWVGRGCLTVRAFLWGPSAHVPQMRRGFKDGNVPLSLCVLG